jgi:malonate transporter
MADALLLLPDLLLILLGYLLCRHTPLNRPVWDGAERLVYYLLFPCLLFHSILRNPLASWAPPAAGRGAWPSWGRHCAGLCAALLPGVDARLHASGAQTAFRFNSYVALALAERLAGGPGVASMALVMSVCVPLCNVAAVWPLARQGGHGYCASWRATRSSSPPSPACCATCWGCTLPELASTTLSASVRRPCRWA